MTQDLVKRDPDPVALDRVPLNYNYGVDPNAESEVQLLDYWRAIRKRLWLIVSIVLLISMLTVVYVSRKPDIFEAKARVQVNLEDNNPTLVGGQPVLYGTSDDPVYFNTQLQILVSSGLIRRVVRTLDLEHNPDFLSANASQKRSTWQSVLHTLGVRKDQPVENKNTDQLPLTSGVADAGAREDLSEAKRLAPFVGQILGGLNVEPVKENRGFLKETRLIDISFTHTDPQVAAKVVNAVAETYVYSNLEKNTETNSSTSDFLQKRIAELQENIRSSEERLVNYAKNNQIVSLDASQNTVVDRLSGLNRQLLEAENDRKTAEAALNAAKAPGAAGAMVDADTKQAGDLESKLAELRQKRAQLLAGDATEEAPEVKEVDGQIKDLDKQIKDLKSNKTSTLLTNLTTRYKQTLDRENLLRKSFEQQRAETLTQNEAAINYRIIQQGIETNKSMLNSLLQRAKENDVVMAGKSNNISIVDYALAPDGPVGPNRTRAVFVSIFLALGLGVGLSLFLEYLDDTVRSTEDVERLLNLPALAVIPSVGSSVKRKILKGSSALQKYGNGSEVSNNTKLLMNVDGRSALAESYRHLRTSVLLSTAGRAPRTLLVTSSLPGEGKTTTAVNTAYSLAQTGASVVLIDADMRRPRLESIFGMRGQLGLSSILSSDVTEEEVLAMIGKDKATGLNVLTAGPIPPNPAELLSSDQMRSVINTLQRTFAHVVIDSPPITSFTDGVLISTMVDGVLLVVHGGKTSRHIVRRSRQSLKDVGAKIFGVVLNNTTVPAHDQAYYQQYYAENYD
ncbi:MAG TPA: polysaccharide biosynthesis tyrosine autokinase [Pyrinomonadaceae bacterium]